MPYLLNFWLGSFQENWASSCYQASASNMTAAVELIVWIIKNCFFEWNPSDCYPGQLQSTIEWNIIYTQKQYPCNEYPNHSASEAFPIAAPASYSLPLWNSLIFTLKREMYAMMINNFTTNERIPRLLQANYSLLWTSTSTLSHLSVIEI